MVLVTDFQEAKAADDGFPQTLLVWVDLIWVSKQNNPQDQCVEKTNMTCNRTLKSKSKYLLPFLQGIKVSCQ